MRKVGFLLAFVGLATAAPAQNPGELRGLLPSLTEPHSYLLKRVSSYDRTGGNADYRRIAPAEMLTLFDETGPGVITHIWITIASPEKYHLKRLVLRMYWDNETAPSVETPIGDFFGLGLGDYFTYESVPLAVGSTKALNCFFPMPFQKSARITVSNEGQEPVRAFYFNIDYRAYHTPLSAHSLYFHAQYRQATPARAINQKANITGEGNYVWMEATGEGHFVGVTMSVLENADGWWGEGDDMFFIDGEKTPSINGTGSEDYFLGAWDFGGNAFSYGLFGAPAVGPERAGARWSMYRFHLDSPITFTKSLRATIEHGHANDRSDNYFSVAYWYQTEPHATFPPLPSIEERLPRLFQVSAK